MALCTKAEVKTYLAMESDDVSKDVLIDALILAAQGFIEEYCNRIFDQASLTEYYKGGSNRIFIKRYPIDKTKTIQVWDSWDRVYATDDLIDSDDYYVDGDDGVIEFDYEVGGSPGSIKVTYTGGYAVADLPSAIKQACIELVARKVKEGPSGALGVPNRSIPEGGTVVFVTDDLLPQTKVVLNTYRRPPGD